MFDTSDVLGAAASDLRKVAEAFADIALVLLFWAVFLYQDLVQVWDVFSYRLSECGLVDDHKGKTLLYPGLSANRKSS